MSDIPDSLERLIGEVLARRENDARFRANVSRGLSPQTETYAYPWVLPSVPESKNKTVFLRAAGLVASYPQIANGEKSLGKSLQELTFRRTGEYPKADKPDIVATRLALLQEQDLEGAVDLLRRFFDLNKEAQIPMNYFAIARMLAHWGNGQSPESQSVRERPLGDYYGAWS